MLSGEKSLHLLKRLNLMIFVYFCGSDPSRLDVILEVTRMESAVTRR